MLEWFVVDGLLSVESSDRECIRRELPIGSIARPLEVGPTEVRRVDIMHGGEFPHAVLLSDPHPGATPSSGRRNADELAIQPPVVTGDVAGPEPASPSVL